ncbi:MAG: hypothetical protein IKJ56_05670 [Bacteroidales bacterium]|nr:hypothetical protein [Bacteroidales bacterium]
MNRKLLLLILLSVTLFSCKDNTKQTDKYVYDYEVYKIQDVILAEEDRSQRIQISKQLVNIDGKNVLILNMQCRSLSFYDLESGEKIHDIFIDTLGNMKSFYYLGKDSIFIYDQILRTEQELETPQALRLIDWEGNVKKIYGYDIDQGELKNYKYEISKLIPPNNNGFVFCQGSIISSSTYSTSYGLLGTKESVENSLPLGIRMDTKENKYHISKHRKYAYIKEGMYYPTYCQIQVSKCANDLPLFRYPYSSTAFEWDFIHDSVIKHHFKSALDDSIISLPSPAEYGYENPYYYGWDKYDEFNQVHLCGIYFNEKIYGENMHGLIFADKNFQYLGEMFNNKHYPTVSNKDMSLNVQRKNDSILTITYLKLVKEDRDYDSYIDSCRNILQTMKQNVENRKNALLYGCPSINFVKSQMDIKESSYKILTLYGEGCIGCDMVTLQTLYENREVLNKVPLYIIVSSGSAKDLEIYIQNNGLTYYDKIAKDTSGIMKSVANTSALLNPRITVVENDIITLDTIYQAIDIENKLLPQITGPNEYTKYALNEDGVVIVTSTH